MRGVPFSYGKDTPPMRRRLLGLLLAALSVALPAGAVDIAWVLVGDPGNPPDTATNCYAADCGSVPYRYYISKYEVTNAQYAEFLNAKAASDPLGLYNPEMGFDENFGGITRSGSDGSYTYEAKAGFESKPVTYVSFYDALRFSNWLNNGQASGDTESGAYTLLGGTATPSNGATVTRNTGPTMVTALPSENEWYKAAYYSPGGTYFDFPTGTNNETGCVAPGSDTGNSANCYPNAYPPGSLTDVGAYGLSYSPHGTYDQGGNVFERTEEIVGGSNRGFRGGMWYSPANSLAASYRNHGTPADETDSMGFRVVPEPGQVLLVLTGWLVLAAARRKRHA